MRPAERTPWEKKPSSAQRILAISDICGAGPKPALTPKKGVLARAPAATKKGMASAELNVNRRFYLPRLPAEFYEGDAVIHWCVGMEDRAIGWLTPTFHAAFREIMLHAAARQKLLCPAYCLMPDHLHLVWMGLKRQSDQRKGMKFLKEHLASALLPFHFQHQAHDHVLREAERKRNAFVKVCFYILDNPRRAGLVEHQDQWQFSGAVLPGYPNLHPLQEDFWRLFWKLYAGLRAPAADAIRKPPFATR
jgi:putative transposase